MYKIKMETANKTLENLSKLKEMFPEVITETKDANGEIVSAVDAKKLEQLLSTKVIEGDECYDFTWVGKKQAMVEACKPIRKTLRPCREESVDWENTQNLYIEGDNLDVLKLLQESYLNKVKMIYIDPPYNTGNDSFIYPDDYTTNKDLYDEEVGAIDESGYRMFKNTETNGRFHSSWCSMMYPRLKLARNLLTDDGGIFIHIDEHEVCTLQKMLQEIFGESNEAGIIIWDKRNPKGEVKGVAYQHEYILVFSKNIDLFANGEFLKKKENAEMMLDKVSSLLAKYKRVDEQVRDEYKEWIKAHKNVLTGGEAAYTFVDDNGDIYRPVSMAAPDKPETRSHRPLIHPITKKPCPIPAKGWRYIDSTMDRLLLEDKIVFGPDENTQPCQKYYLKDNLYETMSSVIYFGGSDDAMGLPFDNPKPVYMAKKIIQTLCKGDSITLDFFSGSATTAHAVMQLNAEDGGNRKFIMVQLPEICDEKSEAYKAGYKNICEIGKERIRRAGKKIVEETGKKDLDIGFRVLKLDSSNMKDVYYAPADYKQTMLEKMTSNIEDGRTAEDLLYACMLEWGLELSLPHKVQKIGGFNVHIVNDGDLVACFDDKISEEAIKQIAEMKPLRAVFRDSSFATDAARVNVGEIFKLKSPNTTIKVL